MIPVFTSTKPQPRTPPGSTVMPRKPPQQLPALPVFFPAWLDSRALPAASSATVPASALMMGAAGVSRAARYSRILRHFQRCRFSLPGCLDLPKLPVAYSAIVSASTLLTGCHGRCPCGPIIPCSAALSALPIPLSIGAAFSRAAPAAYSAAVSASTLMVGGGVVRRHFQRCRISFVAV